LAHGYIVGRTFPVGRALVIDTLDASSRLEYDPMMSEFTHVIRTEFDNAGVDRSLSMDRFLDALGAPDARNIPLAIGAGVVSQLAALLGGPRGATLTFWVDVATWDRWVGFVKNAQYHGGIVLRFLG
jgi:hypothetical protein